MLNALRYSHACLSELIHKFPNGHYIDATLGNGHDIYTILSHPNFKGKVFGFDIQKEAIKRTQERLSKINKDNYELFWDSHENISIHLSHISELSGAIFNLGYLPGGDHHITTTFTSTYKALSALKEKLRPGGQIILVVYSGHPQGQKEKDQLLDHLESWSQKHYQVLHYSYINQKNNPPSCIIIERLKG